MFVTLMDDCRNSSAESEQNKLQPQMQAIKRKQD